MEYSVGSLSDLITGTKTANKPKVVKTKFVNSKRVENVEASVEQPIKKATKRKLPQANGTSPITSTKNTPKSRKVSVDDNIESENSQPKKKRKAKRKQAATNKPDDNVEQIEAENEKTIIAKPNSGKKIKKTANEVNANKRVISKTKKPKIEIPDDVKERTIFVGNVPLTVDKDKFAKKVFRQYGLIESSRIRNISTVNPHTKKRVAHIKKEYHPKRDNVNAYIVFKNKEDAVKALEANGSVFENHHLRVSLCTQTTADDHCRAIYVGNVPFDVTDDEIWELFSEAGKITSVRIVRDYITGMGKGFAYVNFEDADSVQLALEMGPVELKGRILRVSISIKKNIREDDDKPVVKKKTKNFIIIPKKSEQNVEGFEGAKSNEKKKKKKVNKGLQGKKKLVKQIAPRPK